METERILKVRCALLFVSTSQAFVLEEVFYSFRFFSSIIVILCLLVGSQYVELDSSLVRLFFVFADAPCTPFYHSAFLFLTFIRY